MMNEADMLIVIDDSRSNRIKLLVNWAKESQIPIIKIDVETKKSQNYTEVLKIKLVNPSDKEEVKMKINQLEMAKDNAVNSGEFEMAAIIREKIRTIINRKQ
jgi:protein-arginine kinase activator protein McsA